MMRHSIEKALEELDTLAKRADKLHDKADEKYEAGNLKAAKTYENEADAVENKIQGMTTCLKILGLRVWKDRAGRYHIPLDDIEKAC